MSTCPVRLAWVAIAVGLLGCQAPMGTITPRCGSDFTALPGETSGALTVRVTDASGQPAAGARLIVSRNFTGVTCPSSLEAIADAAGTYSLAGIVTGNYSVNLQGVSPAVYATTDVTRGQTATVTLRLP